MSSERKAHSAQPTAHGQHPTSDRIPVWASFALLAAVACALAAAYLPTMARSVTWQNYGADSGDFAAAAVVRGVPHPTGYPTAMLLSQLFLLLPFGEPAARMALMSLVCMALAGGLLAFFIARSIPGGRPTALLCGAVGGLTFGLGHLPWSQAVISEIHGLNALFVILALGLVVEMNARPRRASGWILPLGVLCGLAMGNHLTFAFALLVVTEAAWRISGGWRRFAAWIACLVAGMMVYLYLPLVARTQPAVNWGNPSTLQGFLWVVSGEPYRDLAFQIAGSETIARLGAWSGVVWSHFGLIGVGLALVGLLWGVERVDGLKRTALWAVVAYSVFAVGFYTRDSLVYLVPALMGLSWLMALGIATLMRRLRTIRRGVGLLVPATALLALLFRIPGTLAQADASGVSQAEAYATAVMKEAPSKALILTTQDEDSFPLWYRQYALGERPDLHIVVVPLAQYDWYREGLAATYPDLAVPELESLDIWGWAQELESANPMPVCRTEVQGTRDEVRVDLICE